MTFIEKTTVNVFFSLFSLFYRILFHCHLLNQIVCSQAGSTFPPRERKMGRLSRGLRADAVKIGKIKRFEEGKSRRTGEKGVFAQEVLLQVLDESVVSESVVCCHLHEVIFLQSFPFFPWRLQRQTWITLKVAENREIGHDGGWDSAKIDLSQLHHG